MKLVAVTSYLEGTKNAKERSLSHFWRELWKFDRRWNNWRKLSALGWQTPARVYHNKRYFNKHVHKQKKRTF